MSCPILFSGPYNDEQKVVDATISCSFSFQVPIKISKNSECTIKDFNSQYLSMEDMFDYLAEIYKGKVIGDIAKSAVIDDINIDYD